MTATLGEAFVRAVQLLAGRRVAVAAEPAVVEVVGRVQTLLVEVYFYSMRGLPVIWSTLRHLNLTEPAGPSPDLSRAYVFLAVVCGVASMPRLAARWSRHSIQIAEDTSAPGVVAFALSRATVVALAHCWWDAAGEHIRRADAIASEIGDMRLCEEART